MNILNSLILKSLFSFFILYSFNVYALSSEQLSVKKIANSVGSKICVEEFCFNRTLEAIAYTESSFGNNLINGKKGKKVTAKEINSESIKHKALGSFQILPSTAKFIILKLKLTKYYYMLNNDVLLISHLLYNTEFSANIAGHYLKYHYNKAKVNKWKYAVSKYNGGSNNKTYITLITTKMKNG